MKKSLSILVLSALFLAGCQKDGTQNSQNSKGATVKYSVAPAQTVQTRAAEDGTLVNASGSNKDLSVFAELIGNQFTSKAFDGSGTDPLLSQTVKWSNGAWVGTPVAYWPQATNLTFFACANIPASDVVFSSTGMTMEYTVPVTAAAEKDILLGHYQGLGGNTGTAEILFEHPLTAVRFLYGGIEDNLPVESICLKGVAESGTATMTPDGEISWSNVGSYDYSVSQSDDSGLSVDSTTDLIGEPFIIIPQRLTGHSVNVTVTFTDGTEVVATLSTGEWKSGYTNAYTLNYSNGIGTLIANSPEDYNGKPLGGNILNSNGLNPYNGYPLESHEYVEIGGLKWATMNIGAIKPEECGYYFAWGETTGHKANSAKTGFEDSHSFNWANTPFNNGQTSFNSTYFNNKTEWLDGNATDGYTLKPEYDAAHVLWGGNWRMPTDAEFTQLINNTSHTWTSSYNGSGISGYIFTSTADKSKSIFLPVSGYAYNTSLDQVKTDGWYWSSSLNSQNNFAWMLRIYSGSYTVVGNDRSLGMCIRPVSN